MSVLQTQLYRKDFPGNLGADVTVTNSGTKPVVTPLGSVIEPTGSKVLTAYEWSLIPSGTRTAFGLAGV